MFLKYKHPMCLGLTHLQIGVLSPAQGLAETAFPELWCFGCHQKEVWGVCLFLFCWLSQAWMGWGISRPHETVVSTLGLNLFGWLFRESQKPWTPRCREGMLDLTRRVWYLWVSQPWWRKQRRSSTSSISPEGREGSVGWGLGRPLEVLWGRNTQDLDFA